MELMMGLELLQLAALVGMAAALWRRAPRHSETADELRDESEEERRLLAGLDSLMRYSAGETKEEG